MSRNALPHLAAVQRELYARGLMLQDSIVEAVLLAAADAEHNPDALARGARTASLSFLRAELQRLVRECEWRLACLDGTGVHR